MGRQNMATQCELLQNSNEKGSYQREVSTSGKHLTYDELVQNFLQSNTATIERLKHIGLLASETLCPTCFTPMRWTTCMDRSDGFKYEWPRKCFIAAVEDRTEKTLVSLIRKWIKPQSIIVSDCWKGDINLSKYGYVHETVNHSQEFVNHTGGHTNKIEGHWRQLKLVCQLMVVENIIIRHILQNLCGDTFTKMKIYLVFF